MKKEEIAYALTKQLYSIHTIESNYGPIELDEQMQSVVEKALRPILESRLHEKMSEGVMMKTKDCHHIFGMYDNENGQRAELVSLQDYDVTAFDKDDNFIVFKFCPDCGKDLTQIVNSATK